MESNSRVAISAHAQAPTPVASSSTSPIGLICLQRSQAAGAGPVPDDHQWQPVGPRGRGPLSGFWHMGQRFVVSARDPAGLLLSLVES